MYVMGGVYPHSGLLASFNFSCARYLILSPEECEGAARRAVDNMPGEVRLVFSGNHVGDNIWTGGCLSSRRQFQHLHDDDDYDENDDDDENDDNEEDDDENDEDED